MAKYVFTMTAGRTGTNWLANLFADNFNCTAVHEYLGFGDFGVRSQDIGTMQTFNQWGNNARVQGFWKRKFSLIPECQMYVEANHALAKCGLIENLHMLGDDAEIYIITMRRNWLKQAMSYLTRYDFHNYTVPWAWYLDMRYQNRIVPSEKFIDKGMVGHVVWYILEVEARQEYYRRLYGDKYKFVDAKLETAVTQMGARSMLKHFGHQGAVRLSEKANANPANMPPIPEERVKAFIDRVQFDAEKLVDDYLRAGRRLDMNPKVKQPAS